MVVVVLAWPQHMWVLGHNLCGYLATIYVGTWPQHVVVEVVVVMVVVVVVVVVLLLVVVEE